MPKIIDVALQIQKTNISGKTTHRILKLTKVKIRIITFRLSEMYEVRQPPTPFGVANGTSDDSIIINENIQEAGYHTRLQTDILRCQDRTILMSWDINKVR